ncbi:hypothetical protein Palpr_2210 [Paludibacter propionicigenes WB4]|uniref:Uncharacterized protein n=1 Tax=Paludibacter propionicigenes (strain DSM 17365 / JCM 13257 / WB4) TaxID=694427 RepID=E4T6K2_PALPW|nr:hypothetical protein Palpr_2210 [Paludibacter propionicigenes WB4]
MIFLNQLIIHHQTHLQRNNTASARLYLVGMLKRNRRLVDGLPQDRIRTAAEFYRKLERRRYMEINKNTKNICSIVCSYANIGLISHTVLVKHSTCNLSNSMIISLPGLPYGQHTWGAFSIYIPRILPSDFHLAL